MKKLLSFALALGSAAAMADAEVGKKAPAFAVTSAKGEKVSLDKLPKGWIVLEWYNSECPYVRKHYDAPKKNMQAIQSKYNAQGVTWVTVLSSAKGKEGYLAPAAALKQITETEGASPSNILMDSNGKMGRAYGAKTTPHMFIINPEGNIAYAGAIDDNDSANPAVIDGSHNFVAAALDSGLKKETIKVTSHKPYGCGVKYN